MAAEYEFHPLADIFPLIEGEELAALAASLEKNRLRRKIVLYEGKILDGRNRYRAARVAGLKLTESNFIVYEGDDPLAYVLDANLTRRHLTTEQRAMVAADVAKLRRGVRLDRAGALSTSTQAQAAERMNVSVDSVKRARVVLEHGSLELVAAVKSGAVPLSVAAESVRHPESATPTESVPADRPAPAAKADPSAKIMMDIRRLAHNNLNGGHRATLVSEWIMSDVEVSRAVASKTEVMAQLGGGVAARSSITRWLREDALDSQRADLAKEAVGKILEKATKQRLIEEIAGGVGVPVKIDAAEVQRSIIQGTREEKRNAFSDIWASFDPADRRYFISQWGWQDEGERGDAV
jgi:hypothetical protein